MIATRLIGGISAVALAIVIYIWALLVLLHVTGNWFGCAILFAPPLYVVLLAGGILVLRSAKADAKSSSEAKHAERRVPSDVLSPRQRWTLRAQRVSAFVAGFILIWAGQLVIMLGIPYLVCGLGSPEPKSLEPSEILFLVIFVGIIWMVFGTMLCSYSICYAANCRESKKAPATELCSKQLVRRLSQLPAQKFWNLALGIVCYWTGLGTSYLIVFTGKRFFDLTPAFQVAVVLIVTGFAGTRLSWPALKSERPKCPRK